MKIEALPDEFIDELIAKPRDALVVQRSGQRIVDPQTGVQLPSGAWATTIGLTCDCGWELDNGYCRNPDCEWDAPVETLPCSYCGNCEDPEHCVWSMQCPVCGAEPGMNLCREGSRLVGLHQERWDCVSNRRTGDPN